MSTPHSALPKDSLILITGLTGFVASHTAKQFLERGYRVRGTVRDMAKASWLLTDVFKSYADSCAFELTVVPDMSAANAFGSAVSGVHAVVHAASVVSFAADPTLVIPQVVAGATSILRAALKEPSVQQFVYTGSLVAEAMLVPGNTTFVDADTWNEAAVQLAWAPPPYEPTQGAAVYMASKVAAEKEVWKFSKDNKPHFTVNVVNPGMILGQPLNRIHVETKSAWMRNLWNGDINELMTIPTTYAVDVKDVAVLHVAAVLDPDVKNARIQAWGQACNWNDMLAILRKLRPGRDFIADFPNPRYLSLSTDFTQTLGLLKRWGHQEGWRNLEETIADNLVFLE